MRKAITPIISIIVLLLITVAIAGSGYTFLSGYWGTLTSKQIQAAGTFCTDDGIAHIPISNIGTATTKISDEQPQQVEEYKTDANTLLLLHMNEESVNGAPGGSDVEDFSGNGNHCNENGGVTFNTSGKLNTALSFDGMGDYVNCSNDASLNQNTDELTIEAWVNLSTAGGAILSKGYVGMSFFAYSLEYRSSESAWKACFGGVGSYDDCVDYSHTPQLYTWYHVATTFDNGNATIYLNGEPKNSKIFPNVPTIIGEDAALLPLFIGMHWGFGYFNGIIDEVRIYNRSLSADEMKSQSAWGYLCNGSGNMYECGDLKVVKTSGQGEFKPSFDQASIEPKDMAVLKDTGCIGSCEYQVVLGGTASKVIVNC